MRVVIVAYLRKAAETGTDVTPYLQHLREFAEETGIDFNVELRAAMEIFQKEQR